MKEHLSLQMHRGEQVYKQGLRAPQDPGQQLRATVLKLGCTSEAPGGSFSSPRAQAAPHIGCPGASGRRTETAELPTRSRWDQRAAKRDGQRLGCPGDTFNCVRFLKEEDLTSSCWVPPAWYGFGTR